MQQGKHARGTLGGRFVPGGFFCSAVFIPVHGTSLGTCVAAGTGKASARAFQRRLKISLVALTHTCLHHTAVTSARAHVNALSAHPDTPCTLSSVAAAGWTADLPQCGGLISISISIVLVLVLYYQQGLKNNKNTKQNYVDGEITFHVLSRNMINIV